MAKRISFFDDLSASTRWGADSPAGWLQLYGAKRWHPSHFEAFGEVANDYWNADHGQGMRQ